MRLAVIRQETTYLTNMDNIFPSSPEPSPRGRLGVIIAALLGLAPAGATLGAALLRAAALRRAAGLPLAALLRGRLSARGTSLRRHGSIDFKTSDS